MFVLGQVTLDNSTLTVGSPNDDGTRTTCPQQKVMEAQRPSPLKSIIFYYILFDHMLHSITVIWQCVEWLNDKQRPTALGTNKLQCLFFKQMFYQIIIQKRCLSLLLLICCPITVSLNERVCWSLKACFRVMNETLSVMLPMHRWLMMLSLWLHCLTEKTSLIGL